MTAITRLATTATNDTKNVRHARRIEARSMRNAMRAFFHARRRCGVDVLRRTLRRELTIA
jgi:hypothetical protein